MKEQLNSERSIGRLEGKLDSVISLVADIKGAFEKMEKGRLSVLEISFATLKTEVEVKTRSSAVIISAVISILVGVSSSFIIFWLK